MDAELQLKRTGLVRCSIFLVACLVCSGVCERVLYAQDLPPALTAPLDDVDVDVDTDAGAEADTETDDLDALLDMADNDVGQLSNVKVSTSSSVAPALQAEVTSVSRQVSTVGKSPAAIFVITNEMIRRSGARNVPDALRMAPGVHVARMNANTWSISIRGFSGRFADKLLVQIDGRTLYSPIFGGTIWDVQNVILEDVERIEVIRGPGATIWGANAVNGIINVITKQSEDTQGLLVQGGVGTEEKGFGNVRLGGQLGQNATYRVYGQGFDRDAGFDATGLEADDWNLGQGGMRMDWKPTRNDQFTLQGDYYDGTAGFRNILPVPAPPFAASVSENQALVGGNVLGRWTHTFDDDTSWSTQFYYDRADRRYETTGLDFSIETIDLDTFYRFALGDRHNVIVGAGYRNISDQITEVPYVFEFSTPHRSVNNFSYFIQDEVTLRDDELFLTLGSKFSHNDYTQFEMQPTARLLWTPTERHSIWGSVSRAVRTPSRTNNDLRFFLPPNPALPGVFQAVSGNTAIESEDLLAYEIGMRAQPEEWFSWDATAFYNRYEDLVTPGITGAPFLDVGPPPRFILPFGIFNARKGETYGFELAANLEMTPVWRLYGTYSAIQTDYASDFPGAGLVPSNQIYLQSSWDLGRDWQFDAIWRYADSFGGASSYNTMDLRLAWQPALNFEMALVGRNLLDAQHYEVPADQVGLQLTEVEREIYGMVTWKY